MKQKILNIPEDFKEEFEKAKNEVNLDALTKKLISKEELAFLIYFFYRQGVKDCFLKFNNDKQYFN